MAVAAAVVGGENRYSAPGDRVVRFAGTLKRFFYRGFDHFTIFTKKLIFILEACIN